MVTIIANPDCGNSPRMQILRDFVVAVAERDHEQISAVLADEFSWTLIGDRTIRDRDGLHAWLTAFPSVDAVEFGTLVNHGRGASVDGIFDVADGSRQAFSFVLRFSSTTKTAKVVGVNCYLIPQPANG